jgi:hypothetical protein
MRVQAAGVRIAMKKRLRKLLDTFNREWAKRFELSTDSKPKNEPPSEPKTKPPKSETSPDSRA